MYIFMFVVFPVAFWYYRTSISHTEHGRNQCRHSLLVSFSGFMAACIASGVQAFFTFSETFSSANMIVIFFHWLTPFVIVPYLLYGIFFFWSRDSREFRISSLFLFIAPFYAVWLPYQIIRGASCASFFELFVLPLLYLCLSGTVALEVRRLYAAINSKKRNSIVNTALILFFILIVPSIIAMIWYTGVSLLVWLPFSCAYALFCLYRNRFIVFSGDVDSFLKEEVNRILQVFHRNEPR